MRSILTPLGVSILAVASLSAGCTSTDGADTPPDGTDRIRVVVTTNMLGDIVTATLGDMVGTTVDVEVIMQAGADTHEFSASARQAESMENADLLVVNGLGAEAGIAGIIDSVRDSGTAVFTASDTLGSRVIEGDPHFWLDPDAVATAMTALVATLAETTSLDAGDLTRNAVAYNDRLHALDATITELLSAVPPERRTLVTNHDSLAYFARRYGFTVSGTVISSVSTTAEASAADLETLAGLISDEGVPAIFVETTESDRLAQAVANEAGDDVAVVALFTGSLGAPGGGADTYIDAMTTNAQRIAAALGERVMIDIVLDAFGSDITRQALLGGLLTATITALVGTWVVVRGLAFFGDALAHGVLPGIALAAIWGYDLTLGALASAAVMVLGVNLVNRTTRLSDDTGIGLLFVGMLALGVIILSREATFAGDLTSFLFGDVLGVRDAEIVLGVIVLGVTIIGLVLGHRSFLALAVNRDKAVTLGLRPALAHGALLGLLALSVVSSFRVVGTLLVFGFLVAPPATAVLIVRRIPVAMVVATGFGWSAVVIGLTLSYHHDTAASATVAGVAVAQFFAVLAVTELAATLRRPHPSRNIPVSSR